MKERSLLFFWVAWAVATTSMNASHAQDLRAPFELDTARVLPAKVRSPRFKNIYTSIDEKFDAVGIRQPLGAKLVKLVTWGDVVEAQTTNEEKALTRAMIAKAGLQEDGNPGLTSGDVHVFANTMVPVLAIGVTEQFTLGVALPVFRFDIQADTGFLASRESTGFVNEIAKSNLQKGSEAAFKLNDAINQKLTRLGYNTIQSRQFSALGDARLVGRYQFHRSESLLLTAKGELTAPTGYTPSVDEPLPVSAGDGQWDVGTGISADFLPLSNIRLNGFAGYTVQLPDTRERRLPKNATDSLSSDKEAVTRDLGDVYSLGGSISYEIRSTGLSLGTGYQYQHQNQASISDGGAFASERYRYLEEQFPAEELHTGILSAQFSTIEFFQKKSFPIPFQANLNYAVPLSGRNVSSNRLMMGELVMFF